MYVDGGQLTLSLLQEARSLPSGDHATHHTRSVCPSSAAVSCNREDDMCLQRRSLVRRGDEVIKTSEGPLSIVGARRKYFRMVTTTPTTRKGCG